MKVLHAYLQPKNIELVLGPLKQIPCDKLYIKYYPYPYPHRIARDFLLEHPEYTHIAFHTNDLVVTEQNYYQMLQNFISYPFLDIICGVCNVDMHEEKEVWNVCDNLPTLEMSTRVYHWKKAGSFSGLRRVRFAGFPYMWIKRQVLENINPNGERPIFDGTDLFGKDGYAADLWFCHGCYHSNIPIYADSEIDMLHLRYYGQMLVGIEKPQTVWVHDNKEEILHQFDMEIQPERPPLDLKKHAQNVSIHQKELEKTRLEANISQKT